MVWQVEHSIAVGKVVVKCPWGWLAKGLVKGKVLSWRWQRSARCCDPKVACRWCGALSVLWRANRLQAVKWRWALRANGLVAQNGCCGLR